MRSAFLTILMTGWISLASASTAVYPHAQCGFFIDAAIEGIYVDEPNIGFYGLRATDDTPAAIYDISFLTPRYSGTLGYIWSPNGCLSWFGECLQCYVTTSYFSHTQKKTKLIEENMLLFSVNGGGIGGTLPADQLNTFNADHWESHTDAMVAIGDCFYQGFIIHPAVGFSFLYQNQKFESNLFNEAISFNNGTIYEELKTYYRGVKMELGISHRFCGCFTTSLIPSFGIYSTWSRLEANQNWGQIGFSNIVQSETLELLSYFAGVRGDFLWDWCGYYIGAQAFVDYLSYVPGMFNPREDDDGPSRIVKKNSIRFGGGLVLGTMF